MISKASNGTYKIDRVEVTDHAGNETEYSYADLVNLGFSTEFEIVGAQAADTTAPRTLSDLSAYLTEGFWSDQSTYYRKWNLSDTGINAKTQKDSAHVTHGRVLFCGRFYSPSSSYWHKWSYCFLLQSFDSLPLFQFNPAKDGTYFYFFLVHLKILQPIFLWEEQTSQYYILL